MGSIDLRKPKRKSRALNISAQHYSVGPFRDVLGISFFLFRLCVCAYMLGGWMIPSTSALVFYLLFLPLVAMQRLMNPGSCVIGSIERLLRARRWRDPEAARQGPFVCRVVLPIFGVETSPSTADILSFGAIFVLWLVGLTHLSMLGDPALLSIFP